MIPFILISYNKSSGNLSVLDSDDRNYVGICITRDFIIACLFDILQYKEQKGDKHTEVFVLSRTPLCGRDFKVIPIDIPILEVGLGSNFLYKLMLGPATYKWEYGLKTQSYTYTITESTEATDDIFAFEGDIYVPCPTCGVFVSRTLFIVGPDEKIVICEHDVMDILRNGGILLFIDLSARKFVEKLADHTKVIYHTIPVDIE